MNKKFSKLQYRASNFRNYRSTLETFELHVRTTAFLEKCFYVLTPQLPPYKRSNFHQTIGSCSFPSITSDGFFQYHTYTKVKFAAKKMPMENDSSVTEKG